MARKQAEEGGCFSAEAPPNLKPDHDKAAAPCPLQFRIRALPLAPRCRGDAVARLDVSPWVGFPCTCQRRHEGGIEGELRTVPQGEPVGDHFNPPVIGDGHINVHVRDTHIPRDASATLTANVRDRSFQRRGARGEDPRRGAGSPVVAKGVQPTPTAAGSRSEWEGQAQPPEQKDTELGTGYAHGLVGGRNGEGASGVRPCLREQQRAGRRWKVRKVRLTRALIARTGGSPLPAPQGIASIIPSLSCWGSGRDVKDCRPHRRGETKVAKALPRAVSSGGRGQGDSAIEGTEQVFSSPGCPSLDDGKGVTPGSPVRSGTICTCRTQAESTTPPGKPRRLKTVFGQLLGIELEELCKATCNGIIVVTREPFREVGREGPEEEVSAGHRAEMKKQPGCLQAVKPWDTAEQRHARRA